VYPPPLDKDSPQIAGPNYLRMQRWCVRSFEIPEGLADQYFGEEQLSNSEFFELDSMEAVETLLANWRIDSGIFQAPWRTDYPL
jgi:hypothetical protein